MKQGLNWTLIGVLAFGSLSCQTAHKNPRVTDDAMNDMMDPGYKDEDDWNPYEVDGLGLDQRYGRKSTLGVGLD